MIIVGKFLNWLFSSESGSFESTAGKNIESISGDELLFYDFTL